MEKDKRDLGDLRVYRRRRQGKYAQDSEEEELSREHTGECKKESQKSLEKEKKEKEKKEQEKKEKEKKEQEKKERKRGRRKVQQQRKESKRKR